MSSLNLVENFKCRVCGDASDAKIYTVREMMYGSREQFDYVLCEACGCLQIAVLPFDLARHYPSDYYSQRAFCEPKERSFLSGWLKRRYCIAEVLYPRSLLTTLMRSILPEPADFLMIKPYLIDASLSSTKERILDVGCGASPRRLSAMRRCGFSEVEGIDPYILDDTIYDGINIRRCTLDQVQGTFGLIMFHHSLEHVPDPVQALMQVAKLLRPGGICLIRVPVMGTYFWRHFGVDWVELDAPRHLHLFSLESMGKLASRTGFRVRNTRFDSEFWEIAASVRYQRDVAMNEEESIEQELTPVERQRQRDWVCLEWSSDL